MIMEMITKEVDYEFISFMEIRQKFEIKLNEYLLIHGELIYTPESEEKDMIYAVIITGIGNTDKWFEDEENCELNKELEEENNKLTDKWFKAFEIVNKTLGDDYLVVLNQERVPKREDIIKGFKLALEEILK